MDAQWFAFAFAVTPIRTIRIETERPANGILEQFYFRINVSHHTIKIK